MPSPDLPHCVSFSPAPCFLNSPSFLFFAFDGVCYLLPFLVFRRQAFFSTLFPHSNMRAPLLGTSAVCHSFRCVVARFYSVIHIILYNHSATIRRSFRYPFKIFLRVCSDFASLPLTECSFFRSALRFLFGVPSSRARYSLPQSPATHTLGPLGPTVLLLFSLLFGNKPARPPLLCL